MFRILMQPQNIKLKEEEKMRREMSEKIVALGLVLLLVSLLLPVGALAADKPINWKFSILYSRASGFAEIYEGFGKNIELMSGGRLKIKVIYAGEGIAATKVFGAVSRGLVEVGAPYMAFHAGELPSGVVELGLPGSPDSFAALQALFQEAGWKEILRKAYASKNCYWVNVLQQPAIYMLTTKPVANLQELAKMKIRAPGAYAKMLGNLGVNTVMLDSSEVYTSLATGVVDGVLSANLMDYRDYKFFEVAQYLYPLPATGAQSGSIIVNLDAWNKLPEDLKAIVEMASNEMTLETLRKSYLWEEDARTELVSKGLKMSPRPSDADTKKWMAAGKKTWSAYQQKDQYSAELIEILSEFMQTHGQ
jgi:TRAP-type C4-dicarboxylate transport system substrate-binding protein